MQNLSTYFSGLGGSGEMTQRRRNRVLALAVLTMLVAPPSTLAHGGPPETAGLPGDPSRPTEIAPADDIADYADQWGVTAEEAALDLARQLSAGRLEEQLTSVGKDWFGGLWISHDPSFRVNVATTEPGSEDLQRLVAASDASAFVRIIRVARTLDDLTSAQSRYQLAAQGAYRVHVDVARNKVVIGGPDVQAAQDKLARAHILLEGNDAIEMDTTHVVLAAAVQGGRVLQPECTSGFGVVDLLGFRYATTAAHCLNSLTYQPGSVSLTYATGKFSGSVDMQMHTVPSGSTVSNFVFDGGHNFPLDTRPMIGVRTRSAQVVGGTYCKYGKSTGWGCGELQTKTEPCLTPSPVNTCMFLSRSGVGLTRGGDSGGPVFQGYFAAGWMHACVSNVPTPDCGIPAALIYIAEDYIGQVMAGTTVLVAP